MKEENVKLTKLPQVIRVMNNHTTKCDFGKRVLKIDTMNLNLTYLLIISRLGEQKLIIPYRVFINRVISISIFYLLLGIIFSFNNEKSKVLNQNFQAQTYYMLFFMRYFSNYNLRLFEKNYHIYIELFT